jgi:hypothetical protein
VAVTEEEEVVVTEEGNLLTGKVVEEASVVIEVSFFLTF